MGRHWGYGLWVANHRQHAVDKITEVAVAYAPSGHGAAEQVPGARGSSSQCEQKLKLAHQWHAQGLIDEDTWHEATSTIVADCLHGPCNDQRAAVAWRSTLAVCGVAARAALGCESRSCAPCALTPRGVFWRLLAHACSVSGGRRLVPATGVHLVGLAHDGRSGYRGGRARRRD